VRRALSAGAIGAIVAAICSCASTATSIPPSVSAQGLSHEVYTYAQVTWIGTLGAPSIRIRRGDSQLGTLSFRNASSTSATWAYNVMVLTQPAPHFRPSSAGNVDHLPGSVWDLAQLRREGQVAISVPAGTSRDCAISWPAVLEGGGLAPPGRYYIVLAAHLSPGRDQAYISTATVDLSG
jgi:hypothetical protein